MANESFELNIKVKATSDDAALELVKKQLGEVDSQIRQAGESAKKAEGGFLGLKDGVKELAQTLAGLFALDKIINFLREGARASAAKERAVIQLSNTVRQFGGDAEAAAARTEALASALQKKGFNDDQVIEAVRNVTTQTHDYEQALWAASLAADMSAKTGKSYGESLDLLQGLMAGKQRSVVQAHEDFGTTAATVQGNIDQLDKLFAGYASTLDDTQSKLDAAKQELDDFGKLLGGPVNEVLLFMIKAFKSLGIAVSGVGLAAYQAGTIGFGSWLDMAKGVANFDWKHPLKTGSEAFNNWLTNLKANLKEAKGAWSSWADDSFDILGGAAGAAERGKKGKAAAGAGGDKTAAKEADAVTQLAEAYRDLGAAEAQEAQQKLLEARTVEGANAAFQKAYTARLRAAEMERQAIDARYRQDITQEGLTDKAKQALHDKYVIAVMRSEMKLKADLTKLGDDLTKTYGKDLKDRERLLIENQKRMEEDEKASEQRRQANSKRFEDLHKKREISSRAAELKAMRQELAAELFDLRTNEQRKHEIIKQFAELNTEIAKEEARAKRDLALQTAADAFQAASEAFGNNKALAIAGTIISTYKSAQEAYEAMASIPYVGPALGIAAAAAAVAAGVARAQQISSTDPSASAEGGYDIPYGVNPVTQLHAREMVLPREEADVIRALAVRPSNVFNDRSHGPVIHQHIYNPIGGTTDKAFRDLEKRLKPARRSLDRALSNPSTVRIGSKRKR